MKNKNKRLAYRDFQDGSIFVILQDDDNFVSFRMDGADFIFFKKTYGNVDKRIKDYRG